MAHRAVVMMSAGIHLRGWQQDVHADSRDQEEVVEHGISFIFGKGPRLLKKKVGASLLISGAFSNVIWTPTSATEWRTVSRILSRWQTFAVWVRDLHRNTRKCRVRAEASDLNRMYWSLSRRANPRCNLCRQGGENNARFSDCRTRKANGGWAEIEADRHKVQSRMDKKRATFVQEVCGEDLDRILYVGL